MMTADCTASVTVQKTKTGLCFCSLVVRIFLNSNNAKNIRNKTWNLQKWPLSRFQLYLMTVWDHETSPDLYISQFVMLHPSICHFHVRSPTTGTSAGKKTRTEWKQYIITVCVACEKKKEKEIRFAVQNDLTKGRRCVCFLSSNIKFASEIVFELVKPFSKTIYGLRPTTFWKGIKLFCHQLNGLCWKFKK